MTNREITQKKDEKEILPVFSSPLFKDSCPVSYTIQQCRLASMIEIRIFVKKWGIFIIQKHIILSHSLKMLKH